MRYLFILTEWNSNYVEIVNFVYTSGLLNIGNITDACQN